MKWNETAVQCDYQASHDSGLQQNQTQHTLCWSSRRILTGEKEKQVKLIKQTHRTNWSRENAVRFLLLGFLLV